MTRTAPDSRLMQSLISGVTTAGYYAVPDACESRRMRGLMKALCLAVATGSGAYAARQTLRHELRTALVKEQASDEAQDVDGGAPTASPTPQAGSAEARRMAGMAVLATAGIALTAATVLGTVAIERRIFRAGERRAAAGKRLPHTRTALVYGGLAGALTWVMEGFDVVPDESDAAQ